MAEQEHPQTYLISPSQMDLETFGAELATILDGADIACFRLALATSDEAEISRAADHLREICHARDVAIVIQDHYRLVEPLGLDGCHLSDGAKQVREVRKALGPDAIVGADCATSRHTGMSAAEAGVDYVSFGPVSESQLGSGDVAGIELFQWWSEMIEVPVIATGGLTVELVQNFTSATDFFGIGDEIWEQKQPLDALLTLMAAAK